MGSDLRELTIYTNFNCMLKCKMCYMNGVSQQNNRYEFLQKNQKLDFEVFKKVILDVAKINNDCSFWFMGGEPLLHEHIVDMVKFIKENTNGFIDINTNGMLLEQKGKSLMDAGVDSLTISLDGPNASICDSIRGKNVFDTVSKQLVELLAYKKEKKMNTILNVNFTLINENYMYVTEMMKWCNQFDIDNFYIDFPAFVMMDDGEKMEEFYKKHLNLDISSWKGQIMYEVYEGIDRETLIQQMDEAFKMEKQYGFDIVPHGFGPEALADYFTSDWDKYVMNRTCSKLGYRTTLLPDGGISPCTLYYDIIMGNVTKESFEEIWSGEKYESYRRLMNHQISVGCKRCCDLLDEHDELY